MKIYIPSIKIKNINENLLEPFLCKESMVRYIISQEGILQIQREKLLKINIIDQPIERAKINAIDIIIDRSTWVIEGEWQQVSPFHIKEIISTYTYRLRNDAIVEFIIEKQNGSISDCYFSIRETNKNNNINDDILTFLFHLKLC